MMEVKRFEAVLDDIPGSFRAPEDILGATDLDHAQKVRVLKQWEQDLRLLLVASEENMTGDSSGSPAELLRRVRRALVELGDRPAEDAAPTKSGGKA